MKTLLEQVMFHYDKGVIFFENQKAAIVTYNWKCEVRGGIEEEEEVDEVEYYNIQEIFLQGDESKVVPLRSFPFIQEEKEVNRILEKIRGYVEIEKIEWDLKERHGILRYRDMIAHIHKIEDDKYDIETYSLDNKRINNVYDLSEDKVNEILSDWREQEPKRF
jgi:hypothetical protein